MDKFKLSKTQAQLAELSEEQLAYDQTALDALTIDEPEQNSLTIKILSALGGVFGSLAFVGFMFIAGIYRSEISLAISGFIFLIMGIVIPRISRKIIWDTTSASFYLIGFFSLSFGVDALNLSTNMFIGLCMLIALLTIGIARNYLLTFLSVLTIIGLGVFWMEENNSSYLIHPYIIINSLLLGYLFMNEARLLLLRPYGFVLYYPLRTGLMFGLLFLMLIGGSFIELISLQQHGNWSSSMVIILLVGYLFFRVAEILGVEKLWQKVLIALLVISLLSPTWFYVPIAFSLFVLLLSFYSNYRTGLILGFLSFIYFLSRFYYDLNYSLLNKSIILFGSGIFFLLIYLLFYKKLRTNEKI